MFITVKREGKKVKVAVSEKNCPTYTCFSVDIAHRDGSKPDYKAYHSCSCRHLHGCPSVKIRKEKKWLKEEKK
jgi:hypothetical protein